MSPALDIISATTNGFHRSNGVSTAKKPIDGFGTRAIHVGSDPNEETGAVIPAISLSTTYKQNGIGIHKVCIPIIRICTFGPMLSFLGRF